MMSEPKTTPPPRYIRTMMIVAFGVLALLAVGVMTSRSQKTTAEVPAEAGVHPVTGQPYAKQNPDGSLVNPVEDPGPSEALKYVGEPLPVTQEEVRDATDGSRAVIDDRFGCQTREVFERQVDYALQKDEQAWTQLMTAAMMTGECTQFEVGERVFITDSTWTGLVKIRRRGEIEEFWTYYETIK